MATLTSNYFLDRYVMNIEHHRLPIAKITVDNYDINNVQIVFYQASKNWQLLINNTIDLNMLANGNTNTLSVMFGLLCNTITIMEDDENAYD